MSEDTPSADPAVRAAQVLKFQAEAALANAQAAYAVSQTTEKNWRAEEAELEVKALQKERREKEAGNFDHRVYDFVGSVDTNTAENAMNVLSRWSRLDDKPITLRFSSPGGNVIAGFALYDFIVDNLRGQKHIHITTIGLGYAASMGAVLLQAGDRRLLGKNALLLIHEIASGTIGKLSEMEDEVAFAKKLNERLIMIFADRAKASAAVKPMSAAQIRQHSKRKDFWVNAEEALKYGFIDEIGYI
jgi:ATP-dependent Clp protease protease subunit